MISVFIACVFMSLNISVKSTEEIDYLNGPLMNFLHQFSEFEERNATSQCEAHMQEYLKGLKSKSGWAFKMLDSTAKGPFGFLKGNTKFFGIYDECVNTQHSDKIFTGKYCPVMITDNKKDLIETLEESGFVNMTRIPDTIKGFLQYLFGICIPSTCNATEINTALTSVLNSTLGNIAKISIYEKFCSTNEPVKISKSEWIVFGIIAGFLIITALSTTYDVIYKWRRRKPHLLLASFSLVTNWKLLVSEALNPDEIKPLHGIRALAIGWIVAGHSIIYPLRGPSVNFLDSSEMLQNANFAPTFNAYFSVDTFFFLSGFLVYLSFRRSLVHRGSYDAPMAFIHRYIRLTPPIVIVLMIQATIFRHFGSGPLWNLAMHSAQRDCPDMWLYSLTYVQNYMKPESSCLGQAWYLSADTQLYWSSPLVLFPLQFFPRFGSVLIVFLALASILYSFLIVYLNDFGPTILITTRLTDQFKYEFSSTIARAHPWLIGVAFSYIIFTMDEKKIQVKLSRFWVVVGWLTSMGFIFGSLFGIMAFTTFKYTSLESAFYVPFARLGWTLGLVWIIFACKHGYGGLLNTFLSHRIFQPLGRLSYAVYLLHVPVQLYSFGMTRTNFYQDFRTLLYFYLGDVVISFLLAVPLKLIVELPFGIIDKVLLGRINLLPLPRRKKFRVTTKNKRGNISGGKVELGKINNSFENNSEM